MKLPPVFFCEADAMKCEKCKGFDSCTLKGYDSTEVPQGYPVLIKRDPNEKGGKHESFYIRKKKR